jgi:hypothetical protein
MRQGPRKVNKIEDQFSLSPLAEMSSFQELREAAYALLAAPKRYTSDPDVLNNPVEMERVKAEWATYFAAMAAVLAQYPYSEEEKERRAKCE